MKRDSDRLAPLAVAAVLLLPALAAWTGSARAASPFPDKNLEAAIRDVLKHEPKVELTDEKLQNVYILEAAGKDIKDLTGLEKCKNLALIKLTKNKISDLKPLKDLDESAIARPVRQRDQGHRPPGQSQGPAVHRALRAIRSRSSTHFPD